jgi:hypothetical protein
MVRQKYPKEALRKALVEIGVPRGEHEHRNLRSVVHERAGMPAPLGSTPDSLAEMVLLLSRQEPWSPHGSSKTSERV